MDGKRIKRLIAGIIIGTAGIGVAGLLGGCHSGHGHHATVSEPGDDTRSCQMCYDEVSLGSSGPYRSASAFWPPTGSTGSATTPTVATV